MESQSAPDSSDPLPSAITTERPVEQDKAALFRYAPMFDGSMEKFVQKRSVSSLLLQREARPGRGRGACGRRAGVINFAYRRDWVRGLRAGACCGQNASRKARRLHGRVNQRPPGPPYLLESMDAACSN